MRFEHLGMVFYARLTILQDYLGFCWRRDWSCLPFFWFRICWPKCLAIANIRLFFQILIFTFHLRFLYFWLNIFILPYKVIFCAFFIHRLDFHNLAFFLLIVVCKLWFICVRICSLFIALKIPESGFWFIILSDVSWVIFVMLLYLVRSLVSLWTVLLHLYLLDFFW